MSKKPVNIESTEKAHVARVDKYGNEIKKAYNAAISDAVAIAVVVNFNKDIPFSFAGYGKDKEITAILDTLTSSITNSITKGSLSEWNQSNIANNKLVDDLFSGKGISEDKLSQLYQKNLGALESFQKRKIDGLSLSDRVWNESRKFRSELELSIDLGLLEGKSANEISRDIRGYLNEPDKLFRRVRDVRGNLHLSKNAQSYNPGQGVYRSSYKNAHRLARTETNMAYRNADLKRWGQMPFIMGYEIKMSGRHVVNDICDTLKGKYPSSFKFTGWHPQCFCYMVPIMAGDKEFDNYIDLILNDEELNGFNFDNRIDKLPVNFIGWTKDNFEKVSKAKATPYFVRDNLNKKNILESALKF